MICTFGGCATCATAKMDWKDQRREREREKERERERLKQNNSTKHQNLKWPKTTAGRQLWQQNAYSEGSEKNCEECLAPALRHRYLRKSLSQKHSEDQIVPAVSACFTVSHPSDSSSCSLPIASANRSEESASVSAAASAMDGNGWDLSKDLTFHKKRRMTLSRNWKTASWELMRKMFKPVPPWRSWSARHVCAIFTEVTHCHGKFGNLNHLFITCSSLVHQKKASNSSSSHFSSKNSRLTSWVRHGDNATCHQRLTGGLVAGEDQLFHHEGHLWRFIMWDPPAIKPWSFHSHQGIPIAGFLQGSHLEMDDLIEVPPWRNGNLHIKIFKDI